jgi:hypothetical protein
MLGAKGLTGTGARAPIDWEYTSGILLLNGETESRFRSPVLLLLRRLFFFLLFLLDLLEEDELDELPDDDELDEEDDRWRLFFLELSSVTLSTGGVFGPNADEKVSGPG